MYLSNISCCCQISEAPKVLHNLSISPIFSPDYLRSVLLWMLYLSLVNEPIVASWVKVSACIQELLLFAFRERQNINLALLITNVVSPV